MSYNCEVTVLLLVISFYLVFKVMVLTLALVYSWRRHYSLM